MPGIRRMITFDVPEWPVEPEDAADALADLRRLPGVQSVVLYATPDGRPSYLLDIQLDQSAIEHVDRELDRQLKAYSDYLVNVVRRQYRTLA